MDKKDIPEMEIAFSAITQVGEEVQSFTEEQLNALNLNHLNPFYDHLIEIKNRTCKKVM